MTNIIKAVAAKKLGTLVGNIKGVQVLRQNEFGVQAWVFLANGRKELVSVAAVDISRAYPSCK